MRVALVHDWLTGIRGGEKALEVFCELFPSADLFTLVHMPGTTSPLIERRRIARSAIQWLPFAGTLLSRSTCRCSPSPSSNSTSMATTWSSAPATAPQSRWWSPGRARHLCYCLTPMRYAWDQFDAYFGSDRVGKTRQFALLRPILAGLARWDRATEGRVHRYLAISQYVARRIALYYNRESTLVYPPVDTDFYTPEPVGRLMSAPISVVVSALVPYKRVDLAMMAARQAGVGLSVVGDGPERAQPRGAGRGRHRAASAGARRRRNPRPLSHVASPRFFRAKKTSASCRSRRRRAAGRWSRSAAAARSTPSSMAKPACWLPDASVDALADGLKRAAAQPWDSQRASGGTPNVSRARVS